MTSPDSFPPIYSQSNKYVGCGLAPGHEAFVEKRSVLTALPKEERKLWVEIYHSCSKFMKSNPKL